MRVNRRLRVYRRHAVGMFVVHTGGVWATGGYEQILAGLFWATALSGFFGWLYQRSMPKRLTRIGYEVIYERVPAEIAALREEAEQAALDGVDSSGQPTLGRFYSESMDWFFQRPRFGWSHLLGAGAASQWLEHQETSNNGFRQVSSVPDDGYIRLILRKARFSNSANPGFFVPERPLISLRASVCAMYTRPLESTVTP